MLLNNQYKFFNKKGYSLNPDYTNSIVVSVEEPGDGLGAIINPFTNQDGQLWHVHIAVGGDGYTSDTYLKFTDIYTGKVYISDPTQLTLSATGEILSFTFPYTLTDNQSGFSYPAISLFINQFLEPVSTGLIATDHIFIIEKVLDVNGDDQYVFPRANEYGADPSTLEPFYVGEYTANGTSATVKIQTLNVTGSAYAQEPNKINNVFITGGSIDSIQEGMYIAGAGVLAGTYIVSIDRTYNVITLSNNLTVFGPLSLEIYNPHNLRVGNQIRISGGTALDGVHELTAITTTTLIFASGLNISNTTPTPNSVRYTVIPIFRGYFAPNSDEEFFLFDIEYNVDYPTINKSKEIYFLLDDGSDLAFPDVIPGPGTNDVFKRQLTDTSLHKSALQINLGLQSEYEGVFTAQFMIDDVTYEVPVNIFTGLYEGETIAEDERFSAMLQNFGRDVNREEELILRESDVYEDNPDYVLLNAKRKEMLLEGDNIWPYVGSYKGLVNAVNWFGYYDIRIKEYWLNVNTTDEYYGKYKQMQIPFQLKDKGKNSEAIALLPSLHYKKTSLFGLFYDLVRDGGTYDVAGVPDTVDAFEYSNEEILIKLFALKRYLRDKFLPLNSKIIDIVGEGVYYERYAVNSWNDPVNLLEVNLTRDIDFKVSSIKPQIVDIRPHDSAAGLKTPAYFDLVSDYSTRYDLTKVYINNAGGPYYEIPVIAFPGQAKQQARGTVNMRAYPGLSVVPAIPTGVDYQNGDIITLAGGTYENPIRITVNSVNGVGAVTSYSILAGPSQGDNYSSIPDTYFQSNVYRISGTQYVAANADGFVAPKSEVPLEANSVRLYDKGLKYSTYPEVVFSPNIGLTTSTMTISSEPGTPISYFNDGSEVSAFDNYANVPVAAPVDLYTNFDITWDELPYAWKEMGGGADATLKCYVDALPAGTGAILAVEIVSQGDGYRYAPGFLVKGGGGYGASVNGSIKNGKLKILEYEVQAVGSGVGLNDIITVNPPLPLGGSNAVSTGKIVKANGIPEAVIINVVNQPISQIVLTYANGLQVVTSLQVGDKIYIHEGVNVVAGGSAYTSSPTISPVGGQTGNLYTWDETGRGDMYQMYWRVTLTSPTTPGQQFNYLTGIKSIDELIKHTVYLPYSGKYTVELMVYDTDNNFINEIKTDHVEAFLPEATFSYVTRYVSDCADTWDEFFQEPIPDFVPTANVLSPAPFEGVRYDWDHAGGRWVNPVFTDSTWDDSEVKWEHLEVGNTSNINNFNLPPKSSVDILQVSPVDNLEGDVLGYADSTSPIPVLNPTIYVRGQRIHPEIAPGVLSNYAWIFIRRDDVIYQLEVLLADYSSPLETAIQLTSTPPLAFTQSPTTWEVLREIGGTVVFKGDQMYDAVTNPTGIRIGEYIRLINDEPIPKRKRVGIKAKNIYGGYPDKILLEGGGADNIYFEGGQLGQIYKFRGNNQMNGNLNWQSLPSVSTWVIEPALSNDPEVRDHIGKIYIADAAANNSFGIGCQPANPTSEIRPGFTEINLFVELNGELIYNQRLRTKYAYLDNSTTGSPWSIWNGVTPGPVLGFTFASPGTTLTPGFYPNIGYISNTGIGLGATFNILVGANGKVTSVVPNAVGNNYVTGDILVINGALFGGTTVIDNMTLSITGLATSGIHVVDIVTLDGGSLEDLNTFLTNQKTLGARVWIEYEYNIFPSRSYAGITSGLDADIRMDFNMYPSSGEFIAAPVTEFPASLINDTGWYYDHGIAGGDYSIPVINTGTWRNGRGTIVTVNDSESELLRSDSSFLGSQLEFPEDIAEQHLGTLVQNWKNSRALKWTDMCAHNWNMLDYQNRLACNFKITQVSQNGSIQFNNDNTFLFQGIVGGMSNAQMFSQAVYELRRSDNSGMVKFDYQVGSATGDANYIVGQLDTYNFPSLILNYQSYGTAPVPGDVIIGEYLGPAATISGIGIDIQLTANLPKKLNFIGEATAGSYYIKNITGLLEKDIYVGEIIVSNYLPVSPASPAKVLEIIAVAGQVRQLKLSESSTNTATNLTFNVEWFTPSTNLVSFQHLAQNGTFSIDALAKTPGMDNLGWLISQNGTKLYDWDAELDVSLAHTYPIRNILNVFGYGNGKIGGFEGGLAEFLLCERSLQVYYFEGLSPLGNIGWYPAQQLAPQYSYDTDPAFDNVKDAEAQSNRLPYESGISGAWKWEETYIGIQPTRVPSGASILLSSDASKIAGKTNFSWKLYDETGIIGEVLNSTFMWTFNQPGLYTVELEIADSNGNKKSYMKKDFFDIYEAT